MKSSVAALRAIEFYLPEQAETGDHVAAQFPDWPVAKIEDRTGIAVRHIAAPEQCASDLAVEAARKLFDSGVCSPDQIDFILFCTQTPDYLLPPTACVLQHRLGIPTTAGAFDFNLGSSGFVYGLALAQGLIESQGRRHILLLTADTYSKLIHPADKSVRTIFGDGAAATLISAADGSPPPQIGPFVFGTDGLGAEHLIVPAGGMRKPHSPATALDQTDSSGNIRSANNLFMDGGEIFSFTLNAVPKLLQQILSASGKTKEEIDLFVFHQPNQHMLETLRKQARIPSERFYIYLRDCGNTVSATIPIALKAAQLDGTLKPGALVLLAGFGVGYSWGATLLRWAS
jgi:3-oxoacyl-[acyl-carrier-protein] synthase-3